MSSMMDGFERHTGSSQPTYFQDRKNEKGIGESREPAVSRPGGFKNDPDDSNNPNEVIEKERESVRELEKAQEDRDPDSDKNESH